MTDKTLKNYIKLLNTDSLVEHTIITKLSHNVYFSRVWHKIPTDQSGHTLTGPYLFYFIKNQEQFIATVLDMTVDLHWYVLPNYRGKGYLSAALRVTILPHIFQSRSEVFITINKNILTKTNIRASQNLANALNFKILGSPSAGIDEYRLTKSRAALKKIKEYKEPLSESRVLFLKEALQNISKEVEIIKIELELSLTNNKSLSRQLNTIGENLKSTSHNLYDAFFLNET